MKKTSRFIAVFLLAVSISAQAQVGINSTGANADNSAMLDVSAANKGLLIPRVALTGTNDVTTVSSPATSLLVFNTATAGDVTPGFYYYDGAAWKRLVSGIETDPVFTTAIDVSGSLTDDFLKYDGTKYVKFTPSFTQSNYLYNTKYGVKLLARNDAQTDVDFVLSPKGNGSILAQQPDGTSAGGNIRGLKAVDLQMLRNSATKVASGDYSITIGASNTASSDAATAIGLNNTASGQFSFAAGSGNITSGQYSTAIGYSNTASGLKSFASGLFNTSQSYGETVLGFYATVGSGNTSSFVATDRLFVIGNGTYSVKSDALSILKNGNTIIGGSFTLNGNGSGTSYTFPIDRGTSGNVLTTDGSGGTSWTTPYTGLTNFIESNYLYNTIYGVKLLARNDAQTNVDFVLSPKGNGSILAQQRDGTATGGNLRGPKAVDLQMLRTSATQVANGNYSIAIGVLNTASSFGSTAIGFSNTSSEGYGTAIGYQNTVSSIGSTAIGSSNAASGVCSTAIGSSNASSGQSSFTFGSANTAQSWGETVLGFYATIGTGSSSDIIPTDRLFVIGNGSPSNRSDALTILKNANTTISGSLTLNGNGTGTSLTLPATRGTSGNVLTTDGIGGTSWTTPYTGLTNFTESNYLYNTKYGVKLLARNDAQTNVDFVISSKGTGAIIAQQPDGTTAGGNIRGQKAVDLQMQRTSATQVASGNYSFTIGVNNTASQTFSTAIGSSNTASGQSSFAAGSSNTASGNNSTAIGYANTTSGPSSFTVGAGNIASGDYSFASGYNNTAQSYGESVLGFYATVGSGTTSSFVATDRLLVIGNGTSSVKSDALSILKNGNTTIGGPLTINGNGTGTSLTLPATRGTSGNVLTTDGIGGTSWTTPTIGTVTGVTGTAPIVSSGGSAPAISISAATTSAAGSMSAADKTKVDNLVSSQWTTNGSNIYYASGNVGIGISPVYPLNFGSTLGDKISLFGTATNHYGFGVQDYKLQIYTVASNTDIVFGYGSSASLTETMRVKGTGQIVIPALTINGVLLNDASGAVSSTIGTNGQVLTTNSSGGVSWTTPAVGTVTNVTGTAPIVSSGGSAPAISISAATTSVAGSMSAADKTKLDAITGTNTGNQTITLTGDVTGSGTGSFVTTISAGAVSNTELANMAANTIKVNNTTLAAVPTDLSLTANTFPSRKSTGNITANPITDFAFDILNDPNAAAIRTTIGAGTGNGTVTEVTGSAPIIVANGTTTPAIIILPASTSAAGSMSAADKTKLDGSTHAIGDSYGGGVVFYVYDNGQHGLIAATADQSTGIQWDNGTYTTTNAVRDGIGAGKFNTERIIAN